MKYTVSTNFSKQVAVVICAAMVAMALWGLGPAATATGLTGVPVATTVPYNSAGVPATYFPNDNSKFLRCAALLNPCPRLSWGDYQFWVYGGVDNSHYLTIASFYDGQMLAYRTYGKQNSGDPGIGARYHTSNTVNTAAQSVTLSGQGDIVLSWSELREILPPDPPTFFANPTTPTNGSVTVSIDYPAYAPLKQYRIDAGPYLNYTNSIVMNSNGTIYARTENAEGLMSAVSEYVVSNIDLVPPAAATIAASPTTPTNQGVVVSITYPGDAHVREYRIDGGDWMVYISSVLVTDNSVVYARSTDAAGNISDVSSYQVSNIDLDPPIAATLLANPTASTAGNVTVTIIYPFDAHVREYRIDNGAWQAYTDPVVVTDNNVTVHARSADELGNVSEVSSRQVTNIDREAPVMTIDSDNPLHIAVGSVFSNPQATAVDNVDGDITGRITVSGAVNTSAAGNYSLVYSVTDEAGNLAQATLAVAVFDDVSPVLTLLGNAEMRIWVRTPFVEPGFTAWDAQDGDLTAAVTVTGAVYHDRPGTYKLAYNVTDGAGNAAPEVIRTVIVQQAAQSVIGGRPEPPGQASADTVNVVINGVVASGGTVTVAENNGRTTVSVTLDEDIIEQRLQAEQGGSVIEISALAGGQTTAGVLTGRTVKHLEAKQAIVELQTEFASYTLPAAQINIDAVAGQFGEGVQLEDITIHIEISEPSAHTVQLLENGAAAGQYTLVAPAVEFAVYAAYGDQVVPVTSFHSYVERRIAIPEDVDPNQITTAVVIDPDGSVRHVPTKIAEKNGRYYAVIKSLTNSAYSVVWNPVAFADIEQHWAKDAVNDMGSRLVISGTGDGRFFPDEEVTRAQFAAMLIRALGLRPAASDSVSLTDVAPTAWYSDAVYTAHAYALISGFADGTYRPEDKLTREQAMSIIARAMGLTGLKEKLPVDGVDQTLSRFTDADKVSDWAASGVADSVMAGIVAGKGNDRLAPDETITRAEVAVIIRKLLQLSDLI